MKPTLAIVGAGRVGRALGRRLRERGWKIGAVVAKSLPSARAAARAIGAGRPCTELSREMVAAGVVLIATPDGAIRHVAADLARDGGKRWHGRVVLHTSGALSHAALESLARCGAATGSLHPLQTFSSGAAPALHHTVFGVEGAPAALRMARRIARELGGVPVRLTAQQKPAYHAAGALVSGHVLALVEAATRILISLGFTRRQAMRGLLPLLQRTMENLERLGPHASWTGPISRGDFATVRAHARALRRFPRAYRAAYAEAARLSALLLARRPRAVLQKLESALRG